VAPVHEDRESGRSTIDFGGWSAENGPNVGDSDVWNQIGDQLAKNEVPGAASTPNAGPSTIERKCPGSTNWNLDSDYASICLIFRGLDPTLPIGGRRFTKVRPSACDSNGAIGQLARHRFQSTSDLLHSALTS
jgi:hypothetical protein